MRERWREGERDPPKKLSPFYLPLQDCLPFCLQLIISSRTPPSQPPFDWKRNQREAIEGLAGQLLPLAMSDVLNICGLPKKSEAKWKRRRELPACCHSSLSFSRPVSSKWCVTNPGHYRKRDIGHTDHLCERYEDVFDKICDFSLSLLFFINRRHKVVLPCCCFLHSWMSKLSRYYLILSHLFLMSWIRPFYPLSKYVMNWNYYYYHYYFIIIFVAIFQKKERRSWQSV